jgi:hypothetical protein
VEGARVRPAVVGRAAFGRGLPSVKVGIRLLPEDIRLDILTPEPEAGSSIDLRYRDVDSVSWTSFRPGLSRRVDVVLTGRSQDPVRLRLRCPWYSSEIERLRRALVAALPSDTLLVEEVRPVQIRRPDVAAIAATVVALTVVGVGVVRREMSDRPSASETPAPAVPAGPPGYQRLAGPDSGSPAVGKPWGRPCATEQLVLKGDVSKVVMTATYDVLNGAQAAMSLMMSVPAKRTTTGFTAHGPGGARPELTDVDAPPIDVPVGQYQNAPRRPSDASGGNSVAFWKILPTNGSGDRRLGWVQGNLFPRSLTNDSVRLRKAVRMLLANSVGIAYSERPGSGLRRDPNDSIDGFSADDLRALTLFSGC